MTTVANLDGLTGSERRVLAMAERFGLFRTPANRFYVSPPSMTIENPHPSVVFRLAERGLVEIVARVGRDGLASHVADVFVTAVGARMLREGE